MLNVLTNMLSPEVRHTLVHLLPASLRHRIVDRYIDRRARAFEQERAQRGARWIESIPGWRGLSANATKGNTGDEISNSWRVVRDDDQGNAPICYAQSLVVWDVEWLKGHVDRLLGRKGTVLEFGCNAGRVLHHFADAQYRTIGVDINPKAVEHARASFPSLKEGTFHVGDGAEALNAVPGGVDLVYSCAALRHVAPEKIDAVFAGITRIGPRYVITLEDEASLSYRTFPHDYRGKLGRFGWRLKETHYAIDVERRDAGQLAHGLGTVLRIYGR